MRGARPDLFLGLILLRQLPLGPLAGQFAPGATRLLRRAHLRAHRPAARKILPHRLAGADASAARDVRRALSYRPIIAPALWGSPKHIRELASTLALPKK